MQKNNNNCDRLFETVCDRHNDKITWKQIRVYILKQLRVRGDVKDFFADMEEERRYKEHPHELFKKLQHSVWALDKTSINQHLKQDDLNLSQIITIAPCA